MVRLKWRDESGEPEGSSDPLRLVAGVQLLQRPLVHLLQTVDPCRCAKSDGYIVYPEQFRVAFTLQHDNVCPDTPTEVVLLFGAPVMLDQDGPIQLPSVGMVDAEVEVRVRY